MSETTHALHLLRATLDVLAARPDARARAVRAWVAATTTLCREGIGQQFADAARGTAAEGARLDLRVTHVAARCTTCGTRYLPERAELRCPGCGDTAAELLGRVGAGVDAIEVEAP